MRHLAALILVFGFLPSTWAQQADEKRIVIEMHDAFEKCNSAVFGSDGLITFCSAEKAGKEGLSWQLTHYDTSLNETGKTHILVPRKAILIEAHADDQFLYLCFRNDSKSLTIYRVSVRTLQTDVQLEQVNKDAIISALTSNGDFLYLFVRDAQGAYLKTLNFQNKTITSNEIRWGTFRVKEMHVMALRFDTVAQQLEVTVLGSNAYGREVRMYSFDPSGKLLSYFDPGFYFDRTIHTVYSQSTDGQTTAYWGTYSLDEEGEVRGIFYVRMTNGAIAFQQFIPLLDLQGIKQLSIVQGKSTEEQAQALKGIQLNMHAPVHVDGRAILILEFFEPTRAVSVESSGVTGSGGVFIGSVFDGYLYRTASVVCIDSNGALGWEHTLDLLPASKPHEVREQVHVSTAAHTIALEYPSGEMEKTVVFTLEGNPTTNSSKKRTDLPDVSGFEPWYDDYFISAGYFDNYITFNEESVTDKVIVKRKAYFVHKRRAKIK